MFLPNARIKCDSRHDISKISEFLMNEDVRWMSGVEITTESLTKKYDRYGPLRLLITNRHLLFGYNEEDNNPDLGLKESYHISDEFFNISVDDFLEIFQCDDANQKRVDMAKLLDLL